MKALLINILLNLVGKGEDMVAVYVALIINGRRKFSSVPARLQDEVKADLIALGLEELTVE